MRKREKPPGWFKWAIWGSILMAVIVPTGCMVRHGTFPVGTNLSLWDFE